MSVPAEPPVNPHQVQFKSGTQEHLREVCLAHLNLIHKMSETILAKDRQIKVLKDNNQQLLQRLSRLEKFKHKLLIPEFSNGVVETANSEVVNDENVNLENTNDDESARKRKRGRPATKDKSVGTGPSQPSVNKAVQAKTDSGPTENGFCDSDGENDDYLHTTEPYFTFQGEDFVQEEKDHVAEIMSHAEVPGWRVITFSPSYTMEGTENIEDETILRRHLKFELDEKRRKRWDIQRMREQRHVEKLRARYDDSTGGVNLLNGNANGIPVLNCLSNLQNLRPDKSLIPQPEQATHILVTDELPVTAFGHRVPILTEQEFSLPWE